MFYQKSTFSINDKNKTKKVLFYFFIIILLFSYLFYTYRFVYHNNFQTVIPQYIYRSAQPKQADITQWQEQYKLKSILNLRGHEYSNDTPHAAAAIRKADYLGLTTKFIGISSKNMPSPTELNQIIDFIQLSPKPLLIHCKHGVDRTSMVAAIAKIIHNYDIDNALNEMTVFKGFFPQRHQEIVRTFIYEYKNWLHANNIKSSKTTFLYWIDNIYSKNYFQHNYAKRKAFSYLSYSDWQEYLLSEK